MLIFRERECNYFRRELKGRLLKSVSSLRKGLIKDGSGEREVSQGRDGYGSRWLRERWYREEVV